ncbi:MAG: toll/interleukin-1 receptor domain-containing protein [Hyphomicrobiales bacterium]|nr:toll/interleukin-1 receptor domain-containing protein [Hyphomicrobiales bacterium]
MEGKVFISYRRGDDPGFTQALYMRLENEFAAERLFMDVEGHIKGGDDFVDVLSRQVSGCDVFLAVIGPRWEETLTARAGDPDDFVFIEIKAALDHGKRVIPVLVGGAGMPRRDTLPDGLAALARKQAIGLRPERFKADCQGLISTLKDALAEAQAEREARTEAERRAAEEARLAREAEEKARAEALEREAKAQAVAGLSAAEIRKAEELANWDFVKGKSDPAEFRDHLARFADGPTDRMAREDWRH